MSILDKNSLTQLQNGLNKDMNMQKQGDVTFALNAIRDAHDGGKYDYQSEPGNELVESIPSGFTFMGAINGNNNNVYIFATNQDLNLGTIGIFKEGKYNEVVRTSFTWDVNYPITGEFRVRNGCENIIYWCNGDTWDGYFNFDRPELFKDEFGNWVLNKFKLVPDVSPPKIDLKSVNDSGGSLPLGSYYFQIEILDTTLNSLYKTDLSPQTIIYDDSFGESYNKIDGGLNIAQFTEEIGGVPITSKSITLTISNLDTQFAYLRLNVAREIASNQTIDAHAVAELIPISNETVEFTYTGYDPSKGDYPLDYSQMLVDNIKYDTAYVMEQVQGRLLRANLKSDDRDYSNYQKYASKIITKWVAKEVEVNNVNSVGDPKNPKTYWSCTSFQGDEIYAVGIRYLHSNGLWSPVFHIPGRSSVANDTKLLTVVADSTNPINSNQVWESDVKHLDLQIGDTIEHWKVFNTASITDSQTTVHPYTYEGLMGYYETDNNYPEIRSCDNELIWGKDFNDIDITETTKIRHHRFPDRRLVSHFSSHKNIGEDKLIEVARPFGIKFDNLEYPSSDVVGHQFCYVKRSETNKTVLDSGWFTKEYDNRKITSVDAEGVSLSYIENSVSANNGTDWMKFGTYGRFTSSNILYDNKLFRPDYLKFNRAFEFTNTITKNIFLDDVAGINIFGIYYNHLEYKTSVIQSRQNYKVENQLLNPAKSVTLTGFPVKVGSVESVSPDSVIEVKSVLQNLSDFLGIATNTKIQNSYIYKKIEIKPYGDLFNLNYSYINYNYVNLSDVNEFYNGDILITLSNCTRVLDWMSQDGSLRVLAHTRYEEQSINSALRHGGSINNQYYKVDANPDWALGKFFERSADGKYTLLADNKYEYYAYNKDYNKNSIEQFKTVIPITYNYCSDCLGEFTNKIIFSPKSFDEESFDLYRVNLVNDSITIPAHRGSITGLKYQNNLLLVHTENSLFILQPNPQSLNTDVSQVYLTTGGFLSLPPSEIIQDDIGYAGMQSKQHCCETPNGHAWCDQKRGQVFLFNVKLEELSHENSGMSQWFKQELPSAMLQSYYDVMESDYPNTSTYDFVNNGVGLIMYYDPRFKRLIISKKDYKPVNFSANDNDILGNVYHVPNENKWYYIATESLNIPVYFYDTIAFENKSWTISYSFNTGNFTSWHSYRPMAAFSDSYNYYTLSVSDFSLNRIWRHKHIGNYQKYYNVKYDFVIEWMTYDSSTDVFSSIYYNAYTMQWDELNKQWLVPTNDNDVTFNRGIVYNHEQSSGLFNLTLVNQQLNPYSSLNTSNLNKTVIKTDNTYKISGIYDLLVTRPAFTSAWANVSGYPGYIDQVPRAAGYNFNLSAYEVGNIKDKHVYCRLFYKPAQDYKKVVHLIQTNEMRSIR